MDRLDRQVSQSADTCGFLFFVHFLEIPIVKLTCSFILFSLTFWLNMRNLNVKHRIIQVAIRTPLNISNRFAWYLVYLYPIFYFLCVLFPTDCMYNLSLYQNMSYCMFTVLRLLIPSWDIDLYLKCIYKETVHKSQSNRQNSTSETARHTVKIKQHQGNKQTATGLIEQHQRNKHKQPNRQRSTR